MFAIHSVFILKENILFLEEWIDYHIQLGFNKFYLYDNSKVTKSCHWNTQNDKFKEGKINKYGINYDDIISLSDKELYNTFTLIIKKYKCIDVIEWSPKDDNGNILYNQVQAHNHCLKRMKRDNVEWCANIDMDEFIVLNKHATIQDYIKRVSHHLTTGFFNRNKINAIALSQIRFDTRFNNLNNLVTEINKRTVHEYPLYHSVKIIYNIRNTIKTDVHMWHGVGRIILGNMNDILFNHYNTDLKNNYKISNNIQLSLKAKIYSNSNNYIKFNN